MLVFSTLVYGVPIPRTKASMLRLYHSPLSGNCYKVRLLLSQLGMEYEPVELDLPRSESRSPGFLAKNPHGRVPLLELEHGVHLAESNAILHYLARGTRFLPSEPLAEAQVLRWLFFEQNSLEPPLSGARLLLRFSGKSPDNESVIKRQARAENSLMLMELHLSVRPYFVGDHYTIADTCLYGYTHLAPEAGLPLEGYPAIQGWLDRVTAQPGYFPMTAE
jgi:glutathione S-transferase